MPVPPPSPCTWVPPNRVIPSAFTALAVFQGNQHSARRRCVVAAIGAAPGIDIDRAVRSDRHVAGVAQLVGEDRGAKTRRQRDAAGIARAGGLACDVDPEASRKVPIRSVTPTLFRAEGLMDYTRTLWKAMTVVPWACKSSVVGIGCSRARRRDGLI
jgi:hypothetical protein